MCLTTEKRIEMALAKQNLEGNGKIACDNGRPKSSTSKIRKSPGPASTAVYASRIQSPDQFQKTVVLSSSPPRTLTYSPSESITKQYAGCKWTEPPSPSTLPQPPVHWTQQQSQPFFAMPFQKFCQPEQDIAQQLKVLLKVQA